MAVNLTCCLVLRHDLVQPGERVPCRDTGIDWALNNEYSEELGVLL